MADDYTPREMVQACVFSLKSIRNACEPGSEAHRRAANAIAETEAWQRRQHPEDVRDSVWADAASSPDRQA